MTNIIRQLLMSTYDAHALLEVVCFNGYLGYIWIRGESKIDEVGTMWMELLAAWRRMRCINWAIQG